MTNKERIGELPVVPDWRFKLGVALFVLSLIGPLILIPLVTSLGLSVAIKTSISGGILVGAEVLLVIAAAVMGKSGYTYIKNRAFSYLAHYGPPKKVGRTRYCIGLLVFVVPVLFGWLAPYAGPSIPGYEGNEITYAFVGDLLLLVGLFILGGDFWDKLRALFVHDAKAIFALT